MAVAGSSASFGSVSVSDSVIDAVDRCRALRKIRAGIEIAACQPHELRYLTAGVREGQQALDALLMLIGAAADTHSDHGDDAVGVLLGDGSGVRGVTARREAERARTAAGLT
jgi:hypothetical protein